MLGAGLTLLACGSLRAAAGGAAPDFLSLCAPTGNTTRVLDTRAQCTSGSAVLPLRAVASFPSTPAALAVYSALLFAAYVHNHAQMGGSAAVATLLQAAPVIGGLAAAAAQAADARAHVGDVVVGILVGAAAAASVQTRFLASAKEEDEEDTAAAADAQDDFFSAALKAGSPLPSPVATAGNGATAAARAQAWTSATTGIGAARAQAAWASARAIGNAKAAQASGVAAMDRARQAPAPTQLELTSSLDPPLPASASAPALYHNNFSLVNPALKMLSPHSISLRMAAVHAHAMTGSVGEGA